VILFLFGTILRLIPAINQDIWFDESFTIQILRETKDVISLMYRDTPVPPLQYLFLDEFMKIFGSKLFVIRLPSIIFSVITMVIAWYLASKKSTKAGLIALTIFAFSNYQILFAWQAYVWVMAEAIAIVSALAFFTLFNSPSEKLTIKDFAWLAIFVLCNIDGWITSYPYIWLLPGMFLFCLVKLFQKLILKQKVTNRIYLLSVGCVITVIAIFLYLIKFHLIMEMGSKVFFSTPISFSTLWNTLFYMMGNLNLIETSAPPASLRFIEILVTLSFVYFSTKALIKKHSHDNLYLLSYLIFYGAIISSIIVTLVTHTSFFMYRTFLPISFSLVFILAFLFDDLARNIQGITTVRDLTLIFIFTSISLFWEVFVIRDYYNSNMIRQAAYKIKLASTKDISIGFLPEYFRSTFDYYWYGYDGSPHQDKYAFIKYKDIKNKNFPKEYWLVNIMPDSSFEKADLPSMCPKIIYKENIFDPKSPWAHTYIYLCQP
jgi:uncharacterized membrane protein